MGKRGIDQLREMTKPIEPLAPALMDKELQDLTAVVTAATRKAGELRESMDKLKDAMLATKDTH